MEVDKRVLNIARVADDESSRYAFDCVKFQTDGMTHEAFATNGRAAIRANWPAMVQPDGPEAFLVAASDCKQVKSGIKRIDKRAVAQLKDDDDFTLFTDFNAIGSVFRSPKPENRTFPDMVSKHISDRIERVNADESMLFNIGQLTLLLKAIEDVIGSNGNVEICFDRHDDEQTGLVVDGSGNDCVAQGVLLAIA